MRNLPAADHVSPPPIPEPGPRIPLPLWVVLNVPFALILLISGGLVGYLGYENGTNTARDLTYQLLTESAGRVEQNLDSFFNTARLLTEQNLAAFRLNQLDPNTLSALQQHFLAQVQTYDTIQAVAYGSEQGELAGAWRDVLDANYVIGESDAGLNFTSQYYESSRLGRRGALLLSIPDYDPRTKIWYQSAVQAGQPTWTPIYTWIGERGITIDSAAPVYDETGALLGVLDVALNPSSISEFLQSLSASQNVNVFIVDDSGMLVASSTMAQPYTLVNDVLQRLDTSTISDPFVQGAAQRITDLFGGWTAIDSDERFEFDLEGERSLTQVTPYNRMGSQWWIVVALPESVYMASIQDHVPRTFSLIGISLIISMGLLTWMSWRITRPIMRLSQAAKRFAAGNWSERVAIRRRDEIGELTASFNEMAEQLQNSTVSLQASEAQLRAIFDNAVEAITVAGKQGFVTYNPAFQTMFGYTSPDEVIGKAVPDIIAPAQRPRIAEYVHRRLQGEAAPPLYETRGIRQDGSEFDLEVRVSSYVQNSEIYSVALLRDITERVLHADLLARQTYELNERVKELQCLYRHSTLMVQRGLTLDELFQGTVDLIPPAWQYPEITCARLSIEGSLYTTHHFHETEWRQVRPIKINQEQLGVLEVFYLEERPQAAEGPFLKEERFLIEELSRRLEERIEAWRADTALQEAHDSLEEKVIERTAELQAAKERVEVILNSTIDGIVLAKTDLKIQQTNGAFSRLFGSEIDAYLGESLTSLVCAEPENPAINIIRDYVTEQQDMSIAVRACRWDSTTFDAELSIRHIGDLGVVCVIRDITERNQVEEALRNALITEKELGELKTRFISMASHEFRTPLATILAFTESLSIFRHKLTDEQIDKKLTNIRGQVEHLTDIMEDVLLLARMQTRRMEFNPVIVNLDGLCRSVLHEFQSRPDVRHQVEYFCSPEIDEVMLDRKLMRQIISNLLSNAIKYSPEHRVVHLRLEAAGDIYLLIIQDHGIGIPDSDLKHLFEPFHRASNVQTISGTGLGLAIVKDAVEVHGGTIVVESQVGTGSTFTIRLPVTIGGEAKDGKNSGD